MDLGGLGILNLSLMGMSLRMRWLWLARTDLSKAWTALKLGIEPQARSFLEASVSVVIGDGHMALFLSDKWINGCSIRSLAPNLWTAMPARIRKSRTMREALLD